MRQFLRILGAAVLAAALLDASAGLCFCHRGPSATGPSPTSHSCCHGSDMPGRTALKTAGTCCHIESAEHQATPTVAVQLAPPAYHAVPVDERPVAAAVPIIAVVLPSSSPPPVALRL
jgi:hypothetical protein